MVKKMMGMVFLVLAVLLLAALTLAYLGKPEGETSRIVPGLIVFSVLAADIFSFYSLFFTASRMRRSTLLFSLVLILSLLMTGYFFMVAFVNHGLQNRDHTGVYNDCHKVWAARGLVVEGPDITPNGTQNSIESMRLAFQQGAKGAEVDHFYDAGKKKFIVSHDHPYNLKNGKLLTLEELFSATGKDSYFWLDFKKLRSLNEAELRLAVKRLETISGNGLKKRLYVEGEDPINLSFFRRAGFNTILDSHPLTDQNPFTPMVINLYKALYYFGGFSVMAMNYGDIDKPIYGPHTQKALASIPVFIYHVADDSETLKKLLALDSVRVIIMQNHSLNRYNINACH